MSAKPYYKDKLFWTTSCLGLGAPLMVNWVTRNRLTYRLYGTLAQALCFGFLATSFIRMQRLLMIPLLEAEHLKSELAYINRLSQEEGKYLEDREREIREVFKTVVF